jgi:hypothetical protein
VRAAKYLRLWWPPRKHGAGLGECEWVVRIAFAAAIRAGHSIDSVY